MRLFYAPETPKMKVFIAVSCIFNVFEIIRPRYLAKILTSPFFLFYEKQFLFIEKDYKVVKLHESS